MNKTYFRRKVIIVNWNMHRTDIKRAQKHTHIHHLKVSMLILFFDP